jgi:hypothetical protein
VRGLSFSQRFKYNEMAQRYAIQSDLWRKKMRIREEGYRKPYEAMLSVQGVRPAGRARSEHRPVYGLSRSAKAGATTTGGNQPFSVQCSGDAGGAEASRIPLQGAHRSQAKSREKRLPATSVPSRRSSGKKPANSQAARLRHGGVLGRIQDGHVKLKAKAKARAALSSQSVPSFAPGTQLLYLVQKLLRGISTEKRELRTGYPC